MSELSSDLRSPDVRLPTVHTLPNADAPLTLIDRASLRVGLWLLLRSARSTRRNADHGLHAQRVRNAGDRFVRESAALRLLTLAPRQ